MNIILDNKICFVIRLFLYCPQNLNDMNTAVRTAKNANRRQTAFRLDKELLFYLRRKAERQGKTLNAFVEETLRREVRDDMDWPKIKGPIVVSEEVKQWRLSRQITPEEIAADERLAYLLSK